MRNIDYALITRVELNEAITCGLITRIERKFLSAKEQAEIIALRDKDYQDEIYNSRR